MFVIVTKITFQISISLSIHLFNMLIVVKHKDRGVLSISEYPSIKVAEKEYKKLFPDTFNELVIVEATEYL